MKYITELTQKLISAGYEFYETPSDLFTIHLGEFVLFYLPKIHGREWRLYLYSDRHNRLLRSNEIDMTEKLKQIGVLK